MSFRVKCVKASETWKEMHINYPIRAVRDLPTCKAAYMLLHDAKQPLLHDHWEKKVSEKQNKLICVKGIGRNGELALI